VADTEKSLYSSEIHDAVGEWRTALGEIMPKKPFGVDYTKVLQTMNRDPRIAEKVMEARRGQLLADGVDMATADAQAKADLLKFKDVFGNLGPQSGR
jgi:hypothetical protein